MRTTARTTAFMPGASPPLVNTAMEGLEAAIVAVLLRSKQGKRANPTPPSLLKLNTRIADYPCFLLGRVRESDENLRI